MDGELGLAYVAPPAALAELVTVFYHFRAEGARFDDIERADHAQLRFLMTTAPARYHFADGTVQEAPAFQILGPTTGPTRVVVEGPVELFGCGLLPAGWSTLMGLDASVLSNRVLDPVSLFGSGVRATGHLLRAAPDFAARVEIITALAVQLLDRIDRSRFTFAQAVDAWLAASASPEVDDLTATLGLSRRQVERQCKRLYGAPPKLVARKYRALRAASALARGVPAGELLDGFYDQSHLIREVKQFTGVTPGRLPRGEGRLARLTVEGRSRLAGQVPVLVSGT